MFSCPAYLVSTVLSDVLYSRMRESFDVMRRRSPELDGSGNGTIDVILRPFEFLPRLLLAENCE